MSPDFDAEALEFGEVTAAALHAAGGVELARRAEVDPDAVFDEVAGVLARLGASELDVRTDAVAAQAGAALCRAVGAVVAPHPVAGMLLALDGAPFALVGADGLVDHATIAPTWRVSRLDGTAWVAAPVGERLATRLGPFVGRVVEVTPQPPALADVCLRAVLDAFVVLGALDAAVAAAVAHVRGRVQFDQPLASFQSVQFQLADAQVAVAGLAEVARFGLWRTIRAADPTDALPDALAARLAALDAARTVLRTTQQLHGAAGVCDEYDVSVIARHLQPVLRLPVGAEATASHLAGAIAAHGFHGLFLHGGGA